jgi:hypothetical protein
MLSESSKSNKYEIHGMIEDVWNDRRLLSEITNAINDALLIVNQAVEDDSFAFYSDTALSAKTALEAILNETIKPHEKLLY